MAMLKADDGVVSVSDDDYITFGLASPPLVRPQVVARSGEITAPWGVPFCNIVVVPSSTTPAVSHLRTSRSGRPIRDPMLKEPHHPVVIDCIEERANVGVEHPVHLPAP